MYKRQPKIRYINYFILIHENKIFIRKRTEKNIWKNLFEPPNFDTDIPLDDPNLVIEFLKSKDFFKPLKKEIEIKHIYETKHQLTHQTLYARFWLTDSYNVKKSYLKNFEEVPINQLYRYPIHRLFDKFLNFHNLQSSITNNNVG